MKVLIISHNVISTNDAMGKTMCALFSSFKKDELCQFYIYPSAPNVSKCSSYYRITDKDVLKSYYRFKVKGQEFFVDKDVASENQFFENVDDEKIYRNKKNKKPLRKLLRDLMWKFSRWYSKELECWIKKESPTHIFLAPGYAKFIYNIAFKISKKFNIPIVTYICDDYYFVKKAKGFLARIQQNQLKKTIEKLMSKTCHVITICDELKKCYSEKFSVPATTIMTGSSFTIAEQPRLLDSITELTYLGNIRCNRYISLAEIGRALDKINEVNNTEYRLKIYTAEKDGEILQAFENIKSVKICEFVSGEEFNKVFHSAQILVHVEAFDEDSIDLVKHSISTKIADSLGSGTCLFAYGPSNVASIRYLENNSSAIVCCNKDMLDKKLLDIINDGEARRKVVERALLMAKKNHESSYVGDFVKKIFKR